MLKPQITRGAPVLEPGSLKMSSQIAVDLSSLYDSILVLGAVMSNKSWLQLTDYSNKYEVSISTLRRRIKEDSIEYKLDSGKYFLIDEPPTRKPRGRRPNDDRRHDFFGEGSEIGSAVYFDNDEVAPIKSLEESVAAVAAGAESNEPIFSAANRLLEELKKAYSLILQEKEEQILQLKEEIADLRTLASVLESENDRLRKRLNPTV